MADLTLAEFLQGRRPNTLAGDSIPAPPPRSYGKGSVQSIPQEPLGQSNALSRLAGSFGQPSLDMMRGIREEGQRTGQLPDWGLSDAVGALGTMPMGPFGSVRSGLMRRLSDVPPVQQREFLSSDFGVTRNRIDPNMWSVTYDAGPRVQHVSGYLHPDERALYIGESYLDQAFRGRGMGIAMYQRLIDEAHRLGYTVHSDSAVSQSARRIYDALAERGYNVQRNQFEDRASYPIFTVLPHQPPVRGLASFLQRGQQEQ